MTATLAKARCPQCSNTEAFAIFIRSDDDLVCQSCRESRPLAVSPLQAPRSPGGLSRRRQ